jgi:secondary thiamine-phosphate synthase enzyme
METLTVSTPSGSALVDITGQVQEKVAAARLREGLCVLFVPHTTAGLTLNENWDPDVQHDMLLTLGSLAPPESRHRHSEGNSPAHVKSSLFGASLTLIVAGGQIRLGQWQGIYLAEFDGPRHRQVWIKCVRES